MKCRSDILKSNLLYPLLIIIASSCYGILSTIVKVAMGNGFTSAEAVSSQYIVGFILILLLFVTTQRNFPQISKSGYLIIFVSGIFTGTTGVIYGMSLEYLPASLAVVMLFQFTWIGMFIDCALNRRLPNQTESISLAFLFVGTILAAGILDVDLTNIAWQGWALGFASAISFAIFIQVNSHKVEGVSTIARTFYMSFIALILSSLFLAPEIIWNGKLLNEGLWKFGLVLGAFGTIVPILLFSIAAPKVGGGLTSILSAMELPVAIIASVIVLHEKLTILQGLGIVLVLIGMSLPTVIAQRKAKVKH
ncbi:EamA family transporter [Ureibacillus composti]